MGVFFIGLRRGGRVGKSGTSEGGWSRGLFDGFGVEGDRVFLYSL